MDKGQATRDKEQGTKDKGQRTEGLRPSFVVDLRLLSFVPRPSSFVPFLCLPEQVVTLKSGALPADLEYVEERKIGASLGRSAIRSSVAASAAGLILTIGMGVDSNVLVFERLREELAAGRGARGALRAAFDRVWITIVDTNITSLIAAALLFQFGTGPIRGFATLLPSASVPTTSGGSRSACP